MQPQPRTIPAVFDPTSLPRWAQKNPAVVSRCETNLAYRCDVYRAKTAQTRNMLIKRANG